MQIRMTEEMLLGKLLSIYLMEEFKQPTIMQTFIRGKKLNTRIQINNMFRYNADVRYVGTPQYPKEQYQNYNSPKFIPVHLKPRTDILFNQEKREGNRYKTQTLSSLSRFKILPQRKKQTLQPELKSIESMEIVIGESSRQQKISHKTEGIILISCA